MQSSWPVLLPLAALVLLADEWVPPGAWFKRGLGGSTFLRDLLSFASVFRQVSANLS
ncbi:hypothetical protein [Arthrobacter methylotrophus]|uniref:hypothetical protein n=1 Tax=Arthrobacter methylotrophus TaxID=121291 RepID=UPI0031F07335